MLRLIYALGEAKVKNPHHASACSLIVLYTSGCMLSYEENRLLTETGSETPGGRYFRRYWVPALLASELPEPDCPPVRIRILGEDLLAFRDSEGRVGIVDEFCPHRRASLFW